MGRAIRRIQKHRKALKKLTDLTDQSEHVLVTHYSCESFYNRTNGSSPRITSIAVRNLESGQTSSFSIHHIAERAGYSLNQIEDGYDKLEKLMLDEFYEYANRHTNGIWLHWNMRNISYGFQAIAHRYRVLKGNPKEIPEAQLVDLSRLMHAIYGKNYIAHPQLENLVEANGSKHPDFLSGKEEAEAFDNKEYVKLHMSTLRKVDCLSRIVEFAAEDSLKTNATWKDIYGVHPEAIGEWLKDHWLIAIISFIGAIASTIGLLLYVF